MTLNQLLSEILSLNNGSIVGSNDRSNVGSKEGSTDERMIVSSVVLGNGSAPTDLIHVAYVGEGEDLFIIGAPGNFKNQKFIDLFHRPL
jgi:hypothetical protein